MKRIGHIFEKVIDKANIEAAIRRAAKGKMSRHVVRRVLADVPGHVDKIHALLSERKYNPCPVKERIVHEGARRKERKITTIKFFPDQIIHWCLILQIGPVIEKSSYRLSCGSMPGRGVHYAQKFIERWLRKDRKNTKYVAKLDVSKFYPSIPHEAAVAAFQRMFKDSRLMWLICRVISHWHASVDESGRPIGLPIGFLTSQWFANQLLRPLDCLVKQQLKIRHYVRYMDDLVLFSRNKKELHRGVRAIAVKLAEYGLKLKQNWQVFKPDCRPIDFLGFRFYRDKTTLRRSLMLRITRKCRRVTFHCAPRLGESKTVISYMGWIMRSDSRGLFNARIKPFFNVKAAKKAISCDAKQRSIKHENSNV